MEKNYSFLLLFLGSLLTFLGTWTVEKWKNSQERKEKTRNFILLVKQEFGVVIKALDRLKTVQDYRRYYDYNILGQLDKSIFNLESYKKDAIYLPSSDKQEIFIDLISDISTFSSETRGIQDLYYSESKKTADPLASKKNRSHKKKDKNPDLLSKDGLEKYYDDKKTDRTIAMIEIKRRIDDFIRTLS